MDITCTMDLTMTSITSRFRVFQEKIQSLETHGMEQWNHVVTTFEPELLLCLLWSVRKNLLKRHFVDL